jgi:Flp pilus assembly protein TadB
MTASKRRRQFSRPGADWQAWCGLAGLLVLGVLLLTYLLPVTLLAVTIFCMVIAPMGMVREARRERLERAGRP